jgi:type IV secretion system protein VirB8
MNELRNDKLDEYYEAAESWAEDRQVANDRSRRAAWIVAGIALALALLEAIALVLLIPLKREVPYTLLVDRQTGFVEALKPLEQQSLTPDAALTRSFLVQYVIARETFDGATLQDNYRKVGLWSAGEARDSYVALMQASNPLGPLATLPRAATLDVSIRSVSSLAADRALVRFDTVRSDQGSARKEIDNWAAVITYRFNDASMSGEDRLDNPLGFQVTRYRKDPETLPVVEETREAAGVTNSMQVPPQ